MPQALVGQVPDDGTMSVLLNQNESHGHNFILEVRLKLFMSERTNELVIIFAP